MIFSKNLTSVHAALARVSSQQGEVAQPHLLLLRIHSGSLLALEEYENWSFSCNGYICLDIRSNMTQWRPQLSLHIEYDAVAGIDETQSTSQSFRTSSNRAKVFAVTCNTRGKCQTLQNSSSRSSSMLRIRSLYATNFDSASHVLHCRTSSRNSVRQSYFWLGASLGAFSRTPKSNEQNGQKRSQSCDWLFESQALPQPRPLTLQTQERLQTFQRRRFNSSKY